MADEQGGSSLLAWILLLGVGAGGGYLLFRYRDEILKEIESLETENQRLRQKVTELSPYDKDALSKSKFETTDWRS